MTPRPTEGVEPPTLTEPLEDCLREIYKLELADGHATNGALADRLTLVPSSATAMVKRLAALGLVEHAPYRGATLTDDGRRAALALVRRHRLLERYLTDALGVDLAVVHNEADRLEHRLSPALQERIADVLGHPERDPHGDPIPDRHLGTPSEPDGPDRSIASLDAGDRAAVQRIPDDDPRLVGYLSERGLVPGAQIEVIERAPYEGPVTLRLADTEIAISRQLAEAILISSP